MNDHSVCGTASFCTEPGNAEALNLAKWNMRHRYLIVGITERMESMIRLLGKRGRRKFACWQSLHSEHLLPTFFRGAYEHFKSLNG